MTSSLVERFIALDKALVTHQAYWRFEPFHCSGYQTMPWQDLPELCAFLDTLTLSEIEFYQTHNQALVAALTTYLPQLPLVWQHCQIPTLMLEEPQASRALKVGIPGRKWQQITSMGMAALNIGIAHQSWLEWCSGKGYLGQWLADQSTLPVLSFEWQAALCTSGQALADQHGLPMTFVQGDALSSQCQSVFTPQQHAVALHACGDLHARLIEQVCQQQLTAVTLSPCCYHLIQQDHYQPLSIQGKQSVLGLSKHDLRIPLQETVTGGERVKRHRELEMTYRLGLDALLKTQLGAQDYIPIPSIKKSLLANGFDFFCQWAKEQKSLDIELSELDKWHQIGAERFIQMERLSLVQQVFRRPLEMWLVCDKALRLEQAGYEVSLSRFCSREITPRNILIQAKRQQC